MKFIKGNKVRFTPASGNSTIDTFRIESIEKHGERDFYRLGGISGALFVAESLELVRWLYQGKSAK